MYERQYRYVQANETESKEDREPTVVDIDCSLLRSTISIDISTNGQLQCLRILLVTFAVFILVTTALVYTTYYPLIEVDSSSTGMSSDNQSKPCSDPILRQEWRTLSILQREEYISAVKCLQTRPSRMGFDHTLHDEFTWIHSRMGNFTHITPAFIVWHRYFLHIYETTLRDQCGFSGRLTYWDWSLDSEDMTKAPIWDTKTGFGGNGNENAEESVGKGHCVTDGPFANLTVEYFSAEEKPHCLSRGFLHGDILNRRFGARVRPEALEAILQEPNYEAFNLRLESGPHDAVPRGVRGDFSRETAPNDPVFYSHHTALDRMWWMWQQRDPQSRLLQYGSSKPEHSSDYALDDVFHYEGFAPDKKVRDLMSTESMDLCYTY